MSDRYHFVFLAATTYASCLSGRTGRLAEVLAARGHDVVFVELPSLRAAVRGWMRFGVRPVGGGALRVARLGPLPGQLRRSWPALERSWIRYASERLRRWIPELQQSIVVTSTPWWSNLLHGLPRALLCYDYIDHVSVQAGPGREDLFARWDEQLLSMSDMVTTVSEPLRCDLIGRCDPDRVFMVPNGVPKEWVDGADDPMDRSSLTRRPVQTLAGFVGSLFEWIDVELLAASARALPEVAFSIVGPQRRDVSLNALRDLPNVRRFGPVPFAEVPRVIKAFDVCLIPFKRDIISTCADPLKLYEYCALGKPVVSTIPFTAGGSDVPITVAETTEQFIAAIETASRTDSDEQRTARADFARQHTWDKRADAFIDALRTTLSNRARIK